MANNHARAIIDALRAHYGRDKTKLTDDQIAEGVEHYRPKAKVNIIVIDELSSLKGAKNGYCIGKLPQ